MVFFIVLGLDYGIFKSVFFLDDGFFDLMLLLGYYNNLAYIGCVLYNAYGYMVVLAGLVLLVAMIGTIVLTVDFSRRKDSLSLIYDTNLVKSSSVAFFRF